MSTRSVIALIVAAGGGSRFGGPKQYALLAGKPVIRHTIEAFLAHPTIAGVQVVIAPEHREHYSAAVAGLLLPEPVTGGATRQESVLRGLEAVAASSPEYVLIHDAARPCVSAALIDRVVAALAEAPAVVPVLAVADTLKKLEEGRVTATLDRTGLYCAQTPQGFAFQPLLAAHRRCAGGGGFTDDAAIAEQAGMTVATVAGEAANHKITLTEDLERCRMMTEHKMETRVGSGFDVHRLKRYPEHVERRVMMLCGVAVPSDDFLEGHSDADVGLHALTDALLGAMGVGDLGAHFPPADARWKGVDSAHFLRHACDVLAARGGRVVHLDVTLICESPKISPHRDAMRARIADIAAIDTQRVSVKATTTEGLGLTGRREGIAAQAVATILLPACKG